MATDPGSVPARLHLAAVLGELGQPAEALAQCVAALKRDPQSYVATNNLGMALLRQVRRREAIERFHDAARRGPTRPLARGSLYRAVQRYVWLR